MLYLNKTKIGVSEPMKVASGVTIADEGQALIVINEGGKAVVKPSTGAANEVFAGFAAFERRTPTTLAAKKTFKGTGANQTITIPNYVASTARITKNGGQALGGTPEATIDSAGVLSITSAATTTDVIEVAFTYQPTVAEAERLVGTIVGASAVVAGADVGVISRGEVFVSNYDTSVAWVAGTAPKLGANGVLTTGGSGTTIGDAYVSHAPTEAEPYLGIKLR